MAPPLTCSVLARLRSNMAEPTFLGREPSAACLFSETISWCKRGAVPGGKRVHKAGAVAACLLCSVTKPASSRGELSAAAMACTFSPSALMS